MLSQPDGPFINVAKLNLAKYAQRPSLAKVSKETMWHEYRAIPSGVGGGRGVGGICPPPPRDLTK